ncbi:hypothetical protein AMELA_G00155250 [Ameiurus melas]|uniref:Uncharacterized protein n=1 Tax=Ameiurus melas TaxID=219545 RepID=A0A7J6ADR4_AMEME|nr:hypothetical protein AMELA_G00155250 [Ameiurus melas]
MSQSEGGSTPPPGGDEKQSHLQPQKSTCVSAPEVNSQEVYNSSLSTSLDLQRLEEVTTFPSHSVHSVVGTVISPACSVLHTGPSEFGQLYLLKMC